MKKRFIAFASIAVLASLSLANQAWAQEKAATLYGAQL